MKHSVLLAFLSITLATLAHVEAQAGGGKLSRAQVIDAQRALSANGFDVKEDGVAGPTTKSAVRRFQAQRGLPQTGELDARTVRELTVATQSIPPEEKAAERPASL